MTIIKNALYACLAFSAIATAASANNLTLSDTSFSLFNGSTKIDSALFDVRWGTYSGGVFTPLLGNSFTESNLGYVSIEAPSTTEISVNLSQGDNTTVGAAGTQFAISISLADFGSDYSNGATQIILTDPTWTAPAFVLVGGEDKLVAFTSSTTALRGSYSFSGGNETLNFVASAIPEPSSFAALAGLGMLGFAAMRKRRSA